MAARLVGINHVALEVSDVDAALDWYGRIFAFELRGRAGRNMAFVDMGDQFLAFSAPREQPTRGLRFVDPWGNSMEIVQYDEIQFSKTDAVLHGVGLAHLHKTEAARAELREKGLGA